MINVAKAPGIGARGRWVAVGATLLLGAVLAARPDSLAAGNPAAEAQRMAHLASVGAEADGAWAELETALEAVRDEGRQGAALIVEGSDPPQQQLLGAADRLANASALAAAAGVAERRLRGTLASARPDQAGLIPAGLPTPGDLASIASQLRSAAEAAGPFLERRHASEETLTELGIALAALDDDDLAAARQALDRADAARQVLVDWQQPPVTLALWLETTGRMIDAALALVDASEAGDAAAARAAADAYAAAAEDATRADVSLALSLSETGAGLTSVPLQRLAEALAAISEARAAAASLQG
jgi:hypothetical protein